jgi:uncharacterized protein YndB with AHSA1/START domain
MTAGRWLIAVLLVACGNAPLQAAIGEADAGHLVLNYALPIKATPARAYAATVDIARWWSSDHTYSGDAKNLRIDAKAGGCFCERWKGGSVEHMRVLLAMPGTMLRLAGGLGPLQSGALNGTLTLEFKSGKDGNQVLVSYLISGYFKGGLDKLGGGVDAVLGAQLQRLQQLIDNGNAGAADGSKGR